MVCKKIIGTFCLVLAAVLPFGWVSCGGSGTAEPADIPEVELKTVPLPGDSLMLGFVGSVTVYDTLLFILDYATADAYLQLYGYPSLRPLCRFAVKGKGPGEVLGVVGYVIDGDSLRLFTSENPKMQVYALADLVHGERYPARVIPYPEECGYSSVFGQAKDCFVLDVDSNQGRIRLVDGSGGTIGIRFAIPYKTEEVEYLSGFDPGMITTLWRGMMDVDGDQVVLGTFYGDVLEIYDLKDSTKNRIVRGPDGPPEATVDGGVVGFGHKKGYQDIRIAGDRIYALYDGTNSKDLSQSDDRKRSALRIFDREGRWLVTGRLDRPIARFCLLSDGRTALAVDPTAEYQLCTFTLPE